MGSGMRIFGWFFAALCVVTLPATASAQSGGNWDLKQTFFIGAYYDPVVSSESHLVQHLVKPNLLDEKRALQGNELTPLAREALSAEPVLQQVANMTLAGDTDGNPIALYVSRAQHEQFEFPVPDSDATIYYTVISIAVSLDILTDQAAMDVAKRLESLYTRLQVLEQMIETDRPLTTTELAKHYRDAFSRAVTQVANRAANELQWTRTKARAVFQIDSVRFPKQLPTPLQQLVDGAIAASGATPTEDMRRREEKRLRRELQHTVHQFIADELRQRGIGDIALLPPPSPWSEGRIARLLRNRLRFLDDSPVLSQVDVTAMNGYTISVYLLGAAVKTLKSNSVQASKVFGVQLAARLFRPDPDGQSPAHVPSSIADPAEKTAMGAGGQEYMDVNGLIRPTTRDIALNAIRRAAEQMAPKIIDLIEKTAGEINP